MIIGGSVMKRAISVIIILAMMLSMLSFSATADAVVEGDNGKSIYISLIPMSTSNPHVEIDSIDAGKNFLVAVNFAGNPNEKAESIQSFGFVIQYDSDNVSYINKSAEGLTSSATVNNHQNDAIVIAGWSDTEGIQSFDEDYNPIINESGTLFYLVFRSKTQLNSEQLHNFKIIKSGVSRTSVVSDGKSGHFSIVLAPALTAEIDSTKTIYTSSVASDVKAALTNIKYIDAAGTVSDVASDDADLTVTLGGDIIAGENTATVTYKGASTTVTFAAEAVAVTSISVTAQPSKLNYKSGEALDLTGLEVTATYNDNSSKAVTTYTADPANGTVLTVAENNGKGITVTYEGKTASTSNLIVEKNPVAVPDLQDAEYTGSAITVTDNGADKDKYMLSGTTSATDVGSHSVTATLKDKAETKWVDGNSEDKSITWSITPKTVSSVGFSVTAPAKNGTPQSSIEATDDFTGAIEWEGNPATFAGGTAYTATVTLTATTGHVFAATVTAPEGWTVTRDSDTQVTLTKTFEKTEDKVLTGIEVTTKPAKTMYVHGETLDTTGMVVTASYDDNTSSAVTGYNIAYANGSYLRNGDTSATVTFGTKSAALNGLSVGKKELTVTGLTATNRAYNGTVAVDLTGGALSEVAEGDTVTANFPTSGTVADANAATGKVVTYADITLSGADAANYTVAKPTLTVDISKADLTADVFDITAPEGKTYDGNTVPITLPTLKAPYASDGLQLSVFVNDVQEAAVPANAGTYTITFNSPNGGANFNATANKMTIGTVTIAPKDVTITGLSAENKTYDGNTAATANGTAAIDGMIEGDDVTVSAGTAAFADAYAGTGKTVTFTGYALTGSKAGNYNLTAQPANTTADITAADQDPTITAAASLAKGGNTLDLSTFVTNAEGTVSFEIKNGTAATLDGSTLTSSANTGDVVITVNVTAKNVNNDGANEYNAYTGDGAITVTVVEKDNANVTVSGEAAVTKTYGEDSFKLSANVGNAGTGTGTWTWTTGDNNVATVDNNGNVNIEGAGSTTITATYESNTTIGTAAFDLTVNKAALTVTANANSIVYGDAPAGNGVTYSGFVKGDAATVVTGTVGYTFDYERYGNVGTYEITPNGLNAANYEITYAAGALTVTAKEVGLTWGESTFTYDGTSKAPTATATGLVNNDAVTVTVTGGQTDAGTEYTATANALSGAKAGNYTLPSAKTTSFTINKAASSVNTAPSAAQNLAYTGNAQALVSAGTAAGGEMVYSLTGTGTYSKNIPTGTYAGSYTVYYKVAGDKNHNNTVPASVTATIGAANQTPTITATASLAKGGNKLDLNSLVKDAQGTVSFEIKSGTAATLEGSTLTSTANTGNVVITVNITAKNVNNDGANEYNAYTGDGAITVTVVDKTDANVTIDGEASITKTYGDASFTLTADAEHKGDSNRTWNWTSNNTAVATVADGVVTIKGQGSATITAKFESNNTIGEASVTLTVNKKDVTITGLAAANKVYDGNTTATITGTAAVDGKVGSDNVSVVMGTAAFADKNAANGKTVTFKGFSLTGADSDYYSLKAQPASVTADITPKAVTITGVTAADKVYDGTVAAVITGTHTVDGKIGEDDVTVNVGTASFADANAGEEKEVAFTGFALDGTDKANYVLSAQPAGVKAKITKADRDLAIDKESVLLYPGANSADIVVTIANDADKSAVVSYEFESEIASALLNGKVLTVKSVNEGVATLTIKIAETANYNAAEKTVSVKAVKEFISAIIATAGADDKVAGQLEGDVIKIYGVKAAENAINVDVTVDSSFDKTVAGDTVTIKLKNSSTVVKTYSIDKSEIVAKNENVDLGGGSNTTQPVDSSLSGVTFGEETKAENVVAAAAKELNDIAENYKTSDNTKVDVELTIDIAPKTFDNTNNKMVVDITPSIIVKVDGNTIDDQPEIKEFSGKIKVSVQLPESFIPTIAKLIHGEKDVEFVDVTVDGSVASWEQNRFSDVELIEGKTVSVGYTFFDKTEKTVPYKMTDIGSALEKDSRSGYTFNGWVITADGEKLDGKFKTLTEELFNVLSAAKEITAEPYFVVNYSGGSSVKTVEVKDSANGIVSVDNDTAKTGATVTVIITPDAGYVLKSISVKDENGNDVTVSRALMTAKFTMPEGKVTVEAEFEKAPEFVDVPAGSYYEKAVDWAVEKGITNGVDENHFAPGATCTRAQAVTFLWRALGCPEPTATKSEFTDVTDADAFYYKAVLWATENGVTNGMGGGKFGVNDTVNRAQMATFLARAMNGKAKTAESFADVPADAYYAEAAAWVKENGICNGTGDNKFEGDTDCLRAQIVTMLYRYFVK